jgi:hypothetical protein
VSSSKPLAEKRKPRVPSAGLAEATLAETQCVSQSTWTSGKFSLP